MRRIVELESKATRNPQEELELEELRQAERAMKEKANGPSVAAPAKDHISAGDLGSNGWWRPE